MYISTLWTTNITGIGSVVCDHYSRSTGYRVVLHVFKYRDSASEQAIQLWQSGEASGKYTNSGNSKYIAYNLLVKP